MRLACASAPYMFDCPASRKTLMVLDELVLDESAAKICLPPAMKANAMNRRKQPQKKRDMDSALMG